MDLDRVMRLLSMSQKALGFHQKYLNLCSKDEQTSYEFVTTWGWVIIDRCFIFGWTILLSLMSFSPFKLFSPTLIMSGAPQEQLFVSEWRKKHPQRGEETADKQDADSKNGRDKWIEGGAGGYPRTTDILTEHLKNYSKSTNEGIKKFPLCS